ncbi:hypothetical protein ABW19_dt0208176 [Dactylella cylindrospora]|nr:hypothetical protein ABW19_dt0208176 [Dactylella cylindrospora]
MSLPEFLAAVQKAAADKQIEFATRVKTELHEEDRKLLESVSTKAKLYPIIGSILGAGLGVTVVFLSRRSMRAMYEAFLLNERLEYLRINNTASHQLQSSISQYRPNPIMDLVAYGAFGWSGYHLGAFGGDLLGRQILDNWRRQGNPESVKRIEDFFSKSKINDLNRTRELMAKEIELLESEDGKKLMAGRSPEFPSLESGKPN